MPAKSHFSSVDKFCESCGEKLFLNNHRDLVRKRFCSRKCVGVATIKILKSTGKYSEFVEKAIAACNNPKSNLLKSNKGEKNGRWVADRTKLKNKRFRYEEKEFNKRILEARNYTCELTGQRGGKLSIHHKNGFSEHPELRFEPSNVIVIKKEIHDLYHKMYGQFKDITEDKWNNFIKNKEYLYAI
jgi:ribosomal protein S27AE